MTLIKTLALSTVTFFQYDPKDEEIREYHRKNFKKSGVTLPKDLSTMTADQRSSFDEAKQ